MNLALIAHDSKKELMLSLCIAYSNVLSKHVIFATATTGSFINESTDLNVELLSNGPLGTQQLSARISYNEVDLLIFLRDTKHSANDEKVIEEILNVCDANNIPFATNVASAELLIKALERGDLNWRNLNS